MISITGVKTKQLKTIPDERGRLTEILRCDDPIFSRFGQVYVTTTYPGVVKAWHRHKKQADNIACVAGVVKVVLCDMIPESKTQGQTLEFFIGVHNPMLIHVPPGVWHGWKCISEEEAIVVNIPTEAYDYNNPDEERLAPDSSEIPYDWGKEEWAKWG